MIAIVYPKFYGVGGIARYLDSFLANLPDEHPKIYLITGDKNRRLTRYRGVEIINLPATSNRFDLLIWSLKARRILKQLHKQNKVKWINLHTPPLIQGLFLPGSLPICLTLHTTYYAMSGQMSKQLYFMSQWSRLGVYLKKLMERYIFSRVDKVIALTDYGIEESNAYGYKGPIEVVPNGVDLVKFKSNAQVTKDIDVLFCGRIELRKGSRIMVDVCKHLIQDKPDINICIVGYGEDEDWVRKQLSNYPNNVTFSGAVSLIEVAQYYQRSHVYVSTSFYEGFPRPCIEALASEVPAVVWDLPFYDGLIVDKSKQTVEPGDVVHMVSQIMRLLHDQTLRITIGADSRVLLEKHYNWKHIAKSLLDVFK